MKNEKPKDLVECVKILLKEEGIEEFKNKDPIEYHHSTGRSIRNDWGLWDSESNLHKFFNLIGIYHADDMSGIILDTVHRIINGIPIDLDGQVEHYKDYWKDAGCDMKGNKL